MKTTEPITAPRPPSPATSQGDARQSARLETSERPTLARGFWEILPLVGVVPAVGPPLVLLAGPLLLLAPMLAGPFTLLVTLVVLVVAASALVAFVGAVLVSPYLLLRHLRRRRSTTQASSSAPVVQLAPIESRRAAA